MFRSFSEHQIKVNHEMRGGAGDVTVRSLLCSDGPNGDEYYGKGRLFAEIDIPVGASIGKHTHQGEMECFYIVDGLGLFDDNGTLREVGPGDVCYTASGESHGIANRGEKTLRLVALILFKN